MEIIQARPPNIARLEKAFPMAGLNVVFSWGDRIYNPSGRPLSKPILAHEAVHGARQGREEKSIIEWWDKYVADMDFRLYEELLGHRAEYEAVKAETTDRNARAAALSLIAHKLAHPLYGGVTTYQEARRQIAAERSP